MEWKFLAILGEHHTARPISLSRWMAEEPTTFCDVIKMVYRSSKVEKAEPSTEESARAMNAYQLLREWHVPPGTKRGGSFDGDALKTWVALVKSACENSGHWEPAANHIGQVLFYAPRGQDDLWEQSVCSVLDEADHEGLRRGITSEIMNTRGVFTYTGGADELKIAEHWYRMANLAEEKAFALLGQELRRLADSYKRDSEREAKNNPYERFAS